MNVLRHVAGILLVSVAIAAAAAAAAAAADAGAQTDRPDPIDPEARGPFAFAVVGTAGVAGDRATTALVTAAGDSSARFIVHFELAAPSRDSCSDAAAERRHLALDASAKPVVPVLAAAEWATCGPEAVDPMERLDRTGDLLFDADETLGQRRMPWLRQSAIPRFKRYRENVRWTSGHVLFATLNLPDNNNGFRRGAGRNGEFEDRLVADRAWLARTFHFATERRLAAVVLFFDAAPRFDLPLRAPDGRAAERDGFYEFKLALRDHAIAFKGPVLLVQGQRAQGAARAADPDRPIKDANGRTLMNVRRVTVEARDDSAPHWLRIDVDPTTAEVFRVGVERLFDDPSGELYGSPRVK